VRRSLCAVFAAVAVLSTVACTGLARNGREGSLRALVTSSGTYLCAGGERIQVTYYRLSDNSLDFVKVIFPGGKERTLPNAVSASGARYTDERELVWWTKGDTAFVQTRGPDGKWHISSKDCRRVATRNELPPEFRLPAVSG